MSSSQHKQKQAMKKRKKRENKRKDSSSVSGNNGIDSSFLANLMMPWKSKKTENTESPENLEKEEEL